MKVILINLLNRIQQFNHLRHPERSNNVHAQCACPWTCGAARGACSMSQWCRIHMQVDDYDAQTPDVACLPWSIGIDWTSSWFAWQMHHLVCSCKSHSSAWTPKIQSKSIYIYCVLYFVQKQKGKEAPWEPWVKPAFGFWDHLEIYQITFSYLLSPDIRHMNTHTHTQTRAVRTLRQTHTVTDTKSNAWQKSRKNFRDGNCVTRVSPKNTQKRKTF